MPDSESHSASAELREWIDAYGERLLRSAYLLCGDRAEAEDLVQDTFLAAFESRQSFRRESTVYTWLHGILLNLSRKYWRRRRRLVLDNESVQNRAGDQFVAPAGDREYRSGQLLRALQALSPEHREVIVLRYYEDCRLQEIAAQTGASLGTVKSRLHYAVRALEKRLPGEMNLFATEGTHPDWP
ncbi:MAG TPA: RNA polymerase sigma factor [Candidatus Didemnitutus sp.]|nr:RNA polymerase sigma factor [Candidatus Didemnitutus sp.]